MPTPSPSRVARSPPSLSLSFAGTNMPSMLSLLPSGSYDSSFSIPSLSSHPTTDGSDCALSDDAAVAIYYCDTPVPSKPRISASAGAASTTPSSPPFGPTRVVDCPCTTSSPNTPLTPFTPATPLSPAFTMTPGRMSLQDTPRRLARTRPTSTRSRRTSHEHPPFNPDATITDQALEYAASLDVFDERGAAVPFRHIFWDQRTVVCFIRHFWCPLCQDYISSITRETNLEALQRAGIRLVIISNGSWKMIKSYRNVLQCPFAIYTDPSRHLYNVLGMTRRTLAAGPDAEKGSYVEHGQLGGVVMVLKRAMKMPLANSGDMKQLGGEFCFGPGFQCTYVHRMTTTRSHAPVRAALIAAGFNPSVHYSPYEEPPPATVQAEEPEPEWVVVRQRELDAMEERKRQRRVLTAQRERRRGLDLAAAALGGHEIVHVNNGGWPAPEGYGWMGHAVERSESGRRRMLSLVNVAAAEPLRPSFDTIASSKRGVAL